MTAAFDARAFADAYFDMWNTRATDRAAAYFAETVEYADVSLGVTLRGRAEVVDFMHGLFARFPDVQWQAVDTVTESPQRFVIQWVTRRTLDGAPNVVEGVSVITRVGDLIVRNADYRDRSRK